MVPVDAVVMLPETLVLFSDGLLVMVGQVVVGATTEALAEAALTVEQPDEELTVAE